MKKIIGIVIVSLISFNLYSQPPELPAGAAVSGALKGKIVEAGSNVPSEYANVAVY